jgi:hypothetical protein
MKAKSVQRSVSWEITNHLDSKEWLGFEVIPGPRKKNNFPIPFILVCGAYEIHINKITAHK